MMNHLYPVDTKSKTNNGEDQIVNSFYQQRRARSGNQKYHNLLKKNISFFHPQHQTLNSSVKDQEEQIENSRRTRDMAHPPLPHHLAYSHNLSQPPQARTRSKSFGQIDLEHRSLSTSVPASPLPSNQQKDEYRQHLKQQLNRRININQYLQHFEHENKQNELSLNRELDSTLGKTLKCGHRYAHRQNQNFLGDSKLQIEQTSRNDSNSRWSHTNGLQSRNSLESNNIKKNSSAFEVTKNHTDRYDSSTSLKRSQRSSGHISNSQAKKQKQQKCQHYLNSDELSQLQENSHPLGHISAPQSSYCLKYTYPQLQQDNSLQSRVTQLEQQLQQMRESHRKQAKLIQSIQKMRKVMLGLPEQQQPCSLKELWRWIKHLPRK